MHTGDSAQRVASDSAVAGHVPPDWTPSAAPRVWKYLVLHHTATEGDSVASIDQVHRRRKDPQGKPWLGIGYHFVIGNGHGMEDGRVEPTFRWRQQLSGAHAGIGRYNDDGIGICLVGNFEDDRPTDNQLAATKQLIGALRKQYSIARENIVGHNQVKPTHCPGKNLLLKDIVGR